MQNNDVFVLARSYVKPGTRLRSEGKKQKCLHVRNHFGQKVKSGYGLNQ